MEEDSSEEKSKGEAALKIVEVEMKGRHETESICRILQEKNLEKCVPTEI